MHCKIVHSLNISNRDRSFCYGDGVFETLVYRQGYLVHWHWHWQRLLQGCRVLKIQPPKEMDVVHRIQRVLQDKTSSCLFRVHVSRGSGSQRGYKPTHDVRSICSVSTHPFSGYGTQNRTGVFCETKWVEPSALWGIKHANRLNQVLASMELQSDQQVGFMFNDIGDLVGAHNGNIFLMKNKTIKTPNLNKGGILGTVRKWVLKHYVCEEVHVSKRELEDADCVWVTNSALGICGVKLTENSYTDSLVQHMQEHFITSISTPNDSLNIE